MKPAHVVLKRIGPRFNYVPKLTKLHFFGVIVSQIMIKIFTIELDMHLMWLMWEKFETSFNLCLQIVNIS